jgi:general secretion pathway protein G
LAGVAGYTFVEMLVVATILLVLASAIMPLAKVTSQRMREAELRRALREMRTAIDKYKDAADTGQIGSLEIKAGSDNYPPDLDTLVEGVAAAIVPGQTGFNPLGRPERVRRLHQVRRQGPRRNKVSRLVIV